MNDQGGKMNDKELDTLFKRTFEDFAPEASSDLWDKIEAALAGRKPKRKTIVWKRWIAVAATLALVFSIWMGMREKQSNIDPTLTRVDSNPPIQAPPIEREAALPSKEAKGNTSVIYTAYKPTESRKPLPDIVTPKAVSCVPAAEIEPTTVTQPERAEIVIAALKAFEPIPVEEDTYQKALAETMAGERNQTDERKGIGVSTVLNFVVNSLNTENDPLIRFSESENGILKVDLARRISRR